MRRFLSLAVMCAAALVVSAVNAGPAVAAKGGNNDSAHLCQHGAWKALLSHSAAPFSNQGDCVNYGAQRIDGQPDPTDLQSVCESLSGGSFTDGDSEGLIWECVYNTPPEPSQPATLSQACGISGRGLFITGPINGKTDAQCTPV